MDRVDVVGDVHGQLDALDGLLHELGYDADGRHEGGRRLVFLGDLVDRGPNSLEVAERVKDLCERGGALCTMGNHELNLLEWRAGRTGPKHSNAPTIRSIEADRTRWDPVLDFFATMPLAIELPELRITHAVWHRGCFEALSGALSEPLDSNATEWAPHIALHSPYDGERFRSGVPTSRYPGQWEKALEVFLKGYESRAAEPFRDNDGVERSHVRCEWWRPEHADAIAPGPRVVFGHYWNMPPLEGVHDAFVPPHPSGHPRLRAWLEQYHADVPARGRCAVPAEVSAVCVDYNGVTRMGARACIGAYRHPEAEVAWVCR